MTSSCNCAFTINGVDSDIVFFLSTETNSAPFLADLFLYSGNTARQDTTKAITFSITFQYIDDLFGVNNEQFGNSGADLR